MFKLSKNRTDILIQLYGDFFTAKWNILFERIKQTFFLFVKMICGKMIF